MLGCFFGHKWSRWAPMRWKVSGEDRWVLGQERHCERCGYQEHEVTRV